MTTNQNPTARIVGTAKVNKSCSFDGNKWAWVSIDKKIVLKAFEGSVLAENLGVDFSGDTFTATQDRVAVEGTLKTLNKNGGHTMHHARTMEASGLDDGLTVFVGSNELAPVVSVAHKVAHVEPAKKATKKDKWANHWGKLFSPINWTDDVEAEDGAPKTPSKRWGKLELA